MIIRRLLNTALISISAVTAAMGQGSNGTDTGVPRQVLNPHPSNCCECVSISIAGNNSADLPGKKLAVAARDTNGNFTLKDLAVTIRTDCTDVKITSIKLVPFHLFGLFNMVDVYSAPVNGGITKWPVGAALSQDFTIPASNIWAQKGTKWVVLVTCSGNGPTTQTSTSALSGGCLKFFTLGTGCASCDSAAGSSNCGPTATNGSFTYDLPIGSANAGDTTGILRFFTPDLTNPGPAGLYAYVPASYTVNRGSTGLIESIVSPTTIITVSPLVSNAFTITHKHAASNVAFRVSTISLENSGSLLRADSTFDGTTMRHQQTRTVSGNTTTYSLETGSFVSPAAFVPLRTESLAITPDANSGTETHLATVTESATAISVIQSTYTKFAWGWEKTGEIIDPGTAPLHANLTSAWTYYGPGEGTGPASTGNAAATDGYGMLKSHTRYDGHQETHTYWLNNHQSIVPFTSNPQGLAIIRTWDPSTKTLTNTEKVASNVLSKQSMTYDESVPSITTTVESSATNSLTTVTTLFPFNADFGGEPKTITAPDGTITTYERSYTRNSGIITGKTEIMKQGAFAGNVLTHGSTSSTTYNAHGTAIIGNSTFTANGNSITTNSFEVTAQDNFGRAETTSYFGGLYTTSTSYSCCGVATSTDMHGEITRYAYDGLRRQIKSNTQGVTNQTTYNGLTTETRRYPETVSGSLSPAPDTSTTTLISKTTRNLSGTLTTSESPDPSSTAAGALVATTSLTTYQPGAGLSMRTLTTTSLGAQTTDSLLDGKTFKTTGDLAPQMIHDYTVNTIGLLSSTSYLDVATPKETSTSQSDWAGRTITTNKGTISQTQTYNNVGQLVKSTDADNVTTLYDYDDIGENTTTAIDINNNDQIDFDGTDRITTTLTTPGTYNATAVLTSTTSVYAINGSDSPATVATTHRTPDGLQSWSRSLGVANPAYSTSTIGAAGAWTSTSTSPDGTSTVNTYSNSKLAKTESFTAETTPVSLASITYQYDSLNRPWKQTDARTGTTTTAYLSTTCDATLSVTDPGNRVTAFTYDPQGNRLSTTLPDTTVTYASYDPDGQAKATWGSQTYPTYSVYDYAHRLISLRTKPTIVSGVPTNTGGSLTTWNYSPTTGLLISKRDADNKGADYTHTPAGRLLVAESARFLPSSTTRLKKTHTYNSAGELTAVTYNDSTTPNVSLSYSRTGQQTTITNGVAKTDYLYNANLQLDKETITYDIDQDNTPELVRTIDRSQDSLGRNTGFQLQTPALLTETSATYGYSTTNGRLGSISNGTDTFTYGYTPNSNLIASIVGPAHTVTNTYEATRNVLLTKSNTRNSNNTVISSIGYSVNTIGQRTQAERSTGILPVSTTSYGYDLLGQVISSDSSDNTADRAYEYDAIGNRKKSANSLTLPSSDNYTANALNQYTAIPLAPEAPSYDADGNMTRGPLPISPTSPSRLAWDAENRMIEVKNSSDTIIQQNIYDAGSRKIATIAGGVTTLYVYDGWNSIAVYTGTTPTLTKTNLWGLDLSGTLQGAGGVGGLLSTTDHSSSITSHYPLYDGNGNITEYVGSTATVVAHYEFDPFGNTTVATGTKANDFDYRFSTKPIDPTTGLYYYGYRWYDSLTGRWPSRDPIEERGGVNLYGFLGNYGLGSWDVLGQFFPPGSNPYPGVFPLPQPPPSNPVSPKPGDAMDSDTFIFLSNEDSNAWADAFHARFGAAIEESARKFCIPKKLLAAMVANEMIDWNDVDGTIIDGVGNPIKDPLSVIGGGLKGGIGPAQISVETARKHKLWDNFAPVFNEKWHLNDDRSSIMLAGALLNVYVKKLCIGKENGSFGLGFAESYKVSQCKFDHLCCMSCETVVNADIPPCLYTMMAGIWNQGDDLMAADHKINDDPEMGMVNYPNADRNSKRAASVIPSILNRIVGRR